MRANIFVFAVIAALLGYAHYRFDKKPEYGSGPDGAMIAALMDQERQVHHQPLEGRALPLKREIDSLGCNPVAAAKFECHFSERLVDPQGNQRSANDAASARFVWRDGEWVLVDH